MSTSTGNKRIALNTLIIYLRMAISTLVSLFTTRYVLQALGQDGYGLYNVVGGIVVMFNVVSVGMHTTTRRFINVEMGKASKANLNKIFNVSVILHIGFALSVYAIALTVGLWYIYNILNVQPDKFSDAVFVYFISTTVAAISIITIPFQGLMSAFEKFGSMAIIELIAVFLKIPLIILLVNWQGNALRLYAVGICFIALLSCILYFSFCRYKFYDIVKWRIYKGKLLYQEILKFNTYTSIGAFAYLSRNQGATMIINYFFNTIVNGAFAIVYQIEGFLMLFVNNLSTAAEPQITQSYASGNYEYAYSLVARISKLSMFIMLLVTFSVYVELEFLLKLWLGVLPKGVLVLAYAMLISLFIRSINTSCGALVQASGYLKWFEISNSGMIILGLPISVILFYLDFPPVTIIIVFTVTDFIARMIYQYLMYKIINFNVLCFAKQVFFPVIYVVLLLVLYLIVYKQFCIQSNYVRFVGICISFIYCILVCLVVGMNRAERCFILQNVKVRLHLK